MKNVAGGMKKEKQRREDEKKIVSEELKVKVKLMKKSMIMNMMKMI